jgi:hypothetical protein
MNVFRLGEMGSVFECNEISGNSKALAGERKVLPIKSQVSAYLYVSYI